MSNEFNKEIISTISRTLPLPGADLKNVDGPLKGLSYPERIVKSGKLTPRELSSMFSSRTVATVTSEKYNLALVTRPEFDAPPGLDNMLVAIPQDNGIDIPWDFNQLVENSPDAANDFTSLILASLRCYQGQGASHSMSVLNSSAYDSGQIEEGGNKRLSQSLRFVHAKMYGYRQKDLIDSTPNSSELDLIARPLQGEMNDFVRLAAQELGISLSEEAGFPPVGIKLQKQDDFAKAYVLVHELMTKASGYVIGPKDIYFDISRPTKDQVTFVHGVPLHDPSRITRQQALKNIENFLPKLKKESILVAQYLEAVSEYLSIHENAIIPLGPQFTVLFEINEQDEAVAYFIPADYVPKGANPISGIIPTESRRPLTKKEKREMKSGANEMVNFLQEVFGETRVIVQK